MLFETMQAWVKREGLEVSQSSKLCPILFYNLLLNFGRKLACGPLNVKFHETCMTFV